MFECEDESNGGGSANCWNNSDCDLAQKCLLREAMNPEMPDDRFWEVDEFGQPVYGTD